MVEYTLDIGTDMRCRIDDDPAECRERTVHWKRNDATREISNFIRVNRISYDDVLDLFSSSDSAFHLAEKYLVEVTPR